jgi:hypothetical protein
MSVSLYQPVPYMCPFNLPEELKPLKKVRERTILTERPLFVGEISANF